MVNKTCPYRTQCKKAPGCYERTDKEETWCKWANMFWQEAKDKDTDRDYWKNPVFKKIGDL